MTFLGLLLITGAWLIQYFSKTQKLRKEFVIAYGVGSLILAFDGFVSGSFQILILNAIVGVIAFLTLGKIKK